MGDRYVQSDDIKKILCIDSNIVYGHSVSQPLPYDEIKFDRNVKLEDILNTPDYRNFGFFIEVDLSYPDNIKGKTKDLPFASEKKLILKLHHK